MDSSGSVDENADGGVVTSVATTNSTSVTVDDDRFEVAGDNLKLKDGTSLDFESDSSPISVTITASGDGESATATVSVSINDIDEAPSAPAARGSGPYSVDENDAGAVVTSMDAGVDPEGGAVTHELSDDRFEITSGLVLKLKDGMSLDYETDGASFDLTATAVDAGGNKSEAVTITISLTDVNEAPVITVADGAVDENAEGASVGAVSATDADADDTHSYDVSDDRFEVADGMLKLKDGQSLDHETADTVTVTVTVTDAAGLSDSGDVTVTVNDVNEAPVITAADGDVDENVEGASVGAVSATDVDDGDMHAFSVSDDRFEVADGMLKLKDGVSLDHETDASVTVTVTVTDDGEGALSDSVDVTVTVDNVDEAPSAPKVRQDGLLMVNENASGALVTSLENSVDPEGDAISYSVNDDRFEITAGLVLKLKSGASLDHESASAIDLELTASDPAGNTSDATAITVGVNNVNEAPSVAAADGSVAENAAGATVGAVTVSDPDAGDTHSYSVSDERFVVDGGMLKLKDGESLDYETDASVTLTVTTTDAAGLSGTSAPVTVTVTDVNEDPSVDVSADGTASSLRVPENDMGSDIIPLAAITLTDPDAADAAGLAGRDAQSNTAVTVDGEADDRFEVTLDDDGGLWLSLRSDASLDHEAAVNGIIAVTVTFTDSAGNTGSASADVIVVDINEAPSVTVADGTTSGGKSASSTVEENTPGALLGEITVSDPDDGDTYTLTAEPAPASDGEAPAAASSDGNGSNGGSSGDNSGDDGTTPAPAPNPFEVMQDDDGGWWLKLKDDASLDYEDGEMVDVLVTATDADGLTGTATVTVTVKNIEESPTAPTTRADTLSVDENDAGATVSVLDSSDPQGDEFTFQVWEKEMGPNGPVNVASEHFEIDNVQGTLKLKDGVALDHEMVDSVVLYLTATDSLGHVSNETKVTVAVNDLNEKPTADAMHAPKDVTDGAAGTALSIDPIYLEKLFSDEDDTDSVFTYKLKVSEVDSTLAPLSLKLNVVYSTYTATAPTVADAEYEYTPPADAPSDDDTASTASSDGNGSDGDAATATVIGAVTVTDPDLNGAEGRGDLITYTVSDDRFMVDDSNMLALKAGQTLSADATVTVTATDSYGLSGSGTITVTIASDDDDDSAAPAASSTGASDTAAPATKDVTFITGTITGTPDAGKYGTAKVAVVAVDDGGLESEASDTTFNLVVDDGNDAPTGINLFNNDGSSNVNYQLTVDENAAGVVLGSLTVDDIDSASHPHGQHKLTVDDDRFEVTDSGVLKLKKGESLDHEPTPVLTVTVTATDMNGAKGGLDTTQDITITVTDKNDAPKAIESIGDWWVTVPEDLDADDATEGQWLSFGLEVPGDDNPAFTDQDLLAGDSLTYSISGPSWITIDDETGAIKNKAGTVANPGQYTVTVTATDEGADGDAKTSADNKSAQVSFKIYVAESDADDEDNDAPKIQVEPISGGDYTEGSGKKAVAKVHVTDEDFGLAPHPYGVLKGGKPMITALGDDNPDPNLATDYTSSFELSKEPVKNGNKYTWTVYAKEKNSLNHETADDVTITVRAYNDLNNDDVYQNDEGDQEEINIDVEDANEKPVFAYAGESTDGSSSTGLATDGTKVTFTVQQEESAVVNLYLNLNHLWVDNDSSDDIDELKFTVSEDASWMKVLHAPAKWEDIRDGKDGNTGTPDDVTWDNNPQGPDQAPEDNDMVAIVQIDRMKYTKQAEKGTISLTATDEGGKTGEGEITVNVTDQDLAIDSQAVSIQGTAREGYALTMRFDHTKDPDLASGDSPVVVVYMWQWTETDSNNNTTTTTVKSVGAPAPLMLTQEHVGKVITAKVAYYERSEAAGRDIADRDTDEANDPNEKWLTATTAAVKNVADKGTANIVLKTNGTELLAEVDIMDEDGVDLNDAPVYTWQMSDNGVGGWTNVTDSDKTDTKVDLGGGGAGKYYRVVVTYTDAWGGNERIESGTVKVGKLDPDQAAPDVTGSATVGGTLTVDTTGGGTVQWQKRVDPDGTSGNDDDYWTNISTGASLTLNNSDHGGETLRALVTYKDSKGGATAIVATANQSVTAAPGNRDPVKVKDITIDAGPVETPAEGSTLAAITEVRETVNLASMFQDPDGDELTFTFTSTNSTNSTNDSLQGDNYGYLDPGTGKLVFVTDSQGSHDGNPADGGGNMFVFAVLAADGAQGSTPAATVNIRLNTPPTALDGSTGITIEEGDAGADSTMATVTLNVTDENSTTHEYGQYTWKLEEGKDSDKFKLTPSKTNLDEATLTLKAGSKFSAPDDGTAEVKLQITVTDKAGHFSETFDVTITVNDGNDADTTAPAEDPVPGLKDDEGGTNNDDQVDDDDSDANNHDSDQDGGVPPAPPPASMMIEDDLLDSFVLAIDDIDVA